MNKSKGQLRLVKKVFVACTFVFFASTSNAKPKSPNELLVVGDSWANFLCDDRGYQKTFDQLKIKNLKENSDCKSVTKNGIEAGEWLQSAEHRQLLNLLAKRSQIKYLHLSIGGNDLIARWNKSMSTSEEVDLFERNFQLIGTIINLIVNVRSDLTLVLSGYDFPRFEDGHPIAKFQKIYEHMGSPSPIELNAALIRYHRYLHQRFLTQENYLNRFFAIHHLGLMHYYDGILDAAIPPGTTLNPNEISSLQSPETFGGDLNYMTNKKSMRKWFSLFYDAFHLNTFGNQMLAQHTFVNIIQPQLK
jgi:hypothetical protein